jgi:ATP-dependent DNA helicase DinG
VTQEALTVEGILGPGGSIAQHHTGYEHRPQQLSMASAVESAMSTQRHLLAEAGTGVGKSFAYLVPAILHARQSGERIVISTHTIALQEQLVEKDIPFLQSALPFSFNAELVKGRSNYLGLRRLRRAQERYAAYLDIGTEKVELSEIAAWADGTKDGSLSDIPRHPSSAIWEEVRSDSDDCMKKYCPHFGECFYQRARRTAREASLLIVNHALLFSDLALKALGSSILPDYQHVVFDEGHTIESVASDHLGITVANTQLGFMLARLYSERNDRGILKTRATEPVIPLVRELRATITQHCHALIEWRSACDLFTERLHEPPPYDDVISPRLIDLADEMETRQQEVDNSESRLELEAQVNRCRQLAQQVKAWHSQESSDYVYWLDVSFGRQERLTMNARPIDVGQALRDSLYSKMKSAVITSATLTSGAGNDFTYLQNRIGLKECDQVALGSPFDFKRQLTVYVEKDMPPPSEVDAHFKGSCDAIRKYTLQSGGNAFVLFTSYKMMIRAAEILEEFFKENGMMLLVQGRGLGRTRMLRKFKDTDGSVLFGTDTFWAGVDVPGKALSNVMITKLPFSVPKNPVVEARMQRIEENGGNPFMDYQVPEAVLKFRQGIGRLIRTQDDRGIVVILDSRVVSKFYGKRFLRALPDGEVIMVAGEDA